MLDTHVGRASEQPPLHAARRPRPLILGDELGDEPLEEVVVALSRRPLLPLLKDGDLIPCSMTIALLV